MLNIYTHTNILEQNPSLEADDSRTAVQ